MNKHRGILVWIIAIISSCTLSTQQEMSLNREIHQFIQVRNEGDALSFLNYTPPQVVRYYKDLGDSTFKAKFRVLPATSNSNPNQLPSDIVYWNQGYIKEVSKKDTLIEAQIEISLVQNSKNLDSTTTFYAISKNNTSNWLFVSEHDYFNILGENVQLFKK